MGGKKSVVPETADVRATAVMPQFNKASSSVLRGTAKTTADWVSMKERHSSSARAGQWISEWLRFRQPAAGSDDADRRPAGSRSPFHSPATARAVEQDCRDPGIDADELRDNIGSRTQGFASAAVHRE